MEERWISISEATKILNIVTGSCYVSCPRRGLAKQTPLYQAVRRGKLNHIRIGNRGGILIDREQLDEYIKRFKGRNAHKRSRKV